MSDGAGGRTRPRSISGTASPMKWPRSMAVVCCTSVATSRKPTSRAFEEPEQQPEAHGASPALSWHEPNRWVRRGSTQMSAKAEPHIRIGIGGWTYAPWRGAFYPHGLAHKRELEYASSKLTSIEINGTFYGSQKPDTFARWHDETPADFVFALKAPRFVTARRVLSDAGPAIERFFASGVMELKAKLGPINWQMPPTKAFDPVDFAAFLKLLPMRLEGQAVRHAVELRHDSFR